MLLSEIVFNIRNLIEGGISDNSFDLSNRQIAFIVAYYRAKIIKQQTDQGQSLSPQLISDFGKVELKDQDKYDFNNLHIEKVNKDVLPSIIQAGNKDLITYIGALDGNTSYQLYHPQHHVFKCYRKYTSKLESYKRIGNTFYFYNLNPIQKYVNIQGVAENPLEVQEYLERTNQCSMLGLDFNYPISSAMLDMVYKMIMEAELRLLLNNFKNSTNDSNSNPTGKEN